MDNILIWTKESEQLKQQILFNQKVVEYLRELHPDIINDKGFDTGAMVKVYQNQNLRERIEEEIKLYPDIIKTLTKAIMNEEELDSWDDANLDCAKNVFQKLLKESNEN